METREKYLEELQQIEKEIYSNPDDYMCWLKRSILLYELEEIQAAILSFRKAFKIRNLNCNDPFYNHSLTCKIELYEKKISKLDKQEINEEILEPGFCEDDKSKKDLTIEQLKQKLTMCQFNQVNKIVLKKIAMISHETEEEKSIKFKVIYYVYFFLLMTFNLEKYINILVKIKDKIQHKYKHNNEHSQNQIEEYKFIICKVDYLINSKIYLHQKMCLHHKIFYLKGDCYVNIASIEGGSTNWESIKNIFAIYSEGLKSIVTTKKAIKDKLQGYTKSINFLIKTQGKELTNKKNIGETAIREINNMDFQVKGIEETKYLCLGHIYIEIEEYVESIRSYLTATNYREIKKPYLHKKYSDNIKKLLDKINIKDIKKYLTEVFDNLERKFDEQYYSYIWWRIGENIYFSKKIKSDLSIEYREVEEAYKEALKKPGVYKASILFSRSKLFMSVGKNYEAKKDLEDVLDFDKQQIEKGNEGEKLKLDKYTSTISSLAEVSFHLHRKISLNIFMDKDPIKTIETLFDGEIRWFEELIKNIKNEFYSGKERDKRIRICKERVAYAYFVKGVFLYEKSKVSDSNLGFINEDYLKKSFDAYKKSLFLINEINNDPVITKNFELDILIGLIKTSYNLREFESTEDYLNQGSKTLKKLIDYKNSGKLNKYSHIKERNFEKDFELIEDFRIGRQKNIQQAFFQAEYRKNICLAELFSKNKKVNQITDEDIKKILSPDTVILYWHTGLTEINTFLLKRVNNKLEYIKLGKTTNNNYLDADKYEQYRTFKEYIDNWDSLLKKLKNNLFKVNDKFLKQIDECLKSLSRILDIDLIQNELSNHNELLDNIKINKIILMPHRDLHKIPLHLFFYGFYTDKKEKNFQYNLSYLPSIEIGLNLNLRKEPITEMLIVQSPDSQAFELEANTIYLNSHSFTHLCKNPFILNEKSDNIKEKIEVKLKNNIGFGYLHFSGHASHNYNQPEESFLYLTENDQIKLEYILKCLDFSNYYLVCLSACETALTNPTDPLVEYVGLVSGFLSKGASYVISTLWSVNDLASCFLMIEFYNQLMNEEEHPTIALRKAQIFLQTSNINDLIDWGKKQHKKLMKMIDEIPLENLEKSKFRLKAELYRLKELSSSDFPNSSSDELECPYKHPYYWAGFTITGLTPLD